MYKHGTADGRRHFYTLYFADDQTVTAEDKDDLGYVVGKLQDAYEERSDNNKNKFEYMIFGNKGKEAVAREDDFVSGRDKCNHWVFCSIKTAIGTKKQIME